ncbi:MAG: flagellar motor stator protein MotA [Betaproteobacteria bacterium]|nr:flagellar motor stator protein MotA [Betaproteobacteria bacterium]MCL2885627.1 flagellar motor stator protein MotA [Betaproteobacteria bacterium]
MFLFLGYIVILASSLGTYAVHGNLLALWMPMEYIAIIGLAVGGFVGGNDIRIVKATLAAIPGALKGSRFTTAFYVDVLALLYEILAKVRKEGLMSIEGDVENPEASPIFGKYPNVVADFHVIEFMTDYLRMMVGGNLNTVEIESLMDVELETHHHEAAAPGTVMNRMADGLPAFGIVVAVMGVVNVMGSVGEPPPVLGKMIGGALVGTFLGILISYGFVAPLASLLTQKAEEGGTVYKCIKQVLLASMSGYAPQVAVEFGRKVLDSHARPSFRELEDELKARRGR